MPSTTLYLGEPGCGKSHLMRAHVAALRAVPEAPYYFVVDHDGTWEEAGLRVYASASDWWSEPGPGGVFRGADPAEVAALVVAIGWSVYVDDECDLVLDAGWQGSALRDIVKRGRHLRNRAGLVTSCAAMLATHRPANLPTDVLGLFDRVYIGRLRGHADAERVYREGWLRGSVAEVRDRLTALPTGAFEVWPQP